LRSGETLVTSSYVLLEMHALVQGRLGMQSTHRLHENFEPLVEIIWVDAALHAMALASVLAAGRRQLSLVDCASFVIMRQAGVRQVFTFDEHFREQGFQLASA
jgi:predicted nucleic acid-binding protein